MPSRFLQEIPGELIEWKQSPGMATSRGGTRSRALNSRGERTSGGGYGYGSSSRPLEKPKMQWPGGITATVRDNGDLELAVGDRIRHTDFGEGRVNAVTGEGNKRVAHVQFDHAGPKKLLIKIAPIEKLPAS
jgi:DNA helicase-2/ATP-dependent DNA helicase PcrA